MERSTVRYVGPASAVWMLVDDLRDEGPEVEHEPPPEYRGFPEPATVVILYVAMKAADAVLELGQEALKAAIRRAVAKYRERGGPGQVTEE